MVYCPIIVGLVVYAAQEQTLAQVLAGLAVGIVGWSLTEYIGHRFLFHSVLRLPGGLGPRLQYLMHDVHHVHPNDRLRLVMPLPLSVPIMLVAGTIIRLLFGALFALPVLAGFMAGYVAYDSVHYWLHHGTPKSQLGRRLRRHHMQHHFHDATRGFGVLSIWWDRYSAPISRIAAGPAVLEGPGPTRDRFFATYGNDSAPHDPARAIRYHVATVPGHVPQMPTATASVMLAAGGTGGHLFPAFALAQELGRRDIAVDIITDLRGDRYGADFPPARCTACRRQRCTAPAIAAAKTGYTLARGTAAAFKLLGDVRPSAVVGFGGYPTSRRCLPPLRRIPSALHEQNAVLGRANRCSPSASPPLRHRSRTSPGSMPPSLEGAPHRQSRARHGHRLVERAWRAPGSEGPFSLLVFGGSQGARYFSEAVPPALAALPEPVRRMLFVTQQAREEDVSSVTAAYEPAGIRAQVASFFKNLPEEMAKAHLVIGAGRGEDRRRTHRDRPAGDPGAAAACRRQRSAAQRAPARGGEAGWCLEQKAITAEVLTAAVLQALGDPQLLTRVAANAKSLGRPDAVVRLADLVEGLMGRRPL